MKKNDLTGCCKHLLWHSRFNVKTMDRQDRAPGVADLAGQEKICLHRLCDLKKPEVFFQIAAKLITNKNAFSNTKFAHPQIRRL